MSDRETALSPSHYTGENGFETCEFVERVLGSLESEIDNDRAWHIGSALKYALRAGKKGDWKVDADKCANFLCRAMTGRWLDE